MSCPQKQEIVKILEDKIYPDLGNLVTSYLNFTPPTPEQICILAMKYKNLESIPIFLDILKNYHICPGLEIISVFQDSLIRFKWSQPTTDYYCLIVIPISEYNNLYSIAESNIYGSVEKLI